MPNQRVRGRHYSPQLSRLVVRALYHEAKARQKPMTKLADELLSAALRGSHGMAIAQSTAGPVKAMLNQANNSDAAT